jgi:hypothetical protein
MSTDLSSVGIGGRLRLAARAPGAPGGPAAGAAAVGSGASAKLVRGPLGDCLLYEIPNGYQIKVSPSHTYHYNGQQHNLSVESIKANICDWT